MKKFYIIVSIILVVLFAAACGYILWHNLSGTKTPGQTTNPVTFPTSTTTPGANITVALRLTNGSTVTVANFVPANQPEGADAVNGYQVAEQNEQAYAILYYPNNSGFLLSLLQEPLGETRRTAETYLQSKLGLTKDQLCQLNVQVYTSIAVNESYAGTNLGLSFCTGAVKLPQ